MGQVTRDHFHSHTSPKRLQYFLLSTFYNPITTVRVNTQNSEEGLSL